MILLHAAAPIPLYHSHPGSKCRLSIPTVSFTFRFQMQAPLSEFPALHWIILRIPAPQHNCRMLRKHNFQPALFHRIHDRYNRMAVFICINKLFQMRIKRYFSRPHGNIDIPAAAVVIHQHNQLFITVKPRISTEIGRASCRERV